MTQVVTASSVRDMIGVDVNGGQWADAPLNGHITAAQDELEHSTSRWFIDRPTTTFTVTTNGRAQLYIPGFRTISGVTLAGSALNSGNYYPIADLLQTGVYTALQLRPFTAHSRLGRPWYYHLGGATTNWFDTNADSQYDPRNYGGGWDEASLPNDLVISGDGGFATANLPPQFLNAVKFLAAFYAARTQAILADVAITPAGGVLNYAQFQAEAQAFIARWKIGEQAVSV